MTQIEGLASNAIATESSVVASGLKFRVDSKGEKDEMSKSPPETSLPLHFEVNNSDELALMTPSSIDPLEYEGSKPASRDSETEIFESKSPETGETSPTIPKNSSILDKTFNGPSEVIEENGPVIPFSSLEERENEDVCSTPRKGSISSISSSDSTKRLIRNLSINGVTLDKNEKVEATQSSVDISPALASETPIRSRTYNKTDQNESKKPVKFTVRKVSRDAGLPKDENGGKMRPITHRYGNLPENKSKVLEKRMGDKESQLKHNQSKFDEYATRIEKIEKEIRFLSTLLPPYNVEIDYPTRSKITRAIEKLRGKKDEIEKRKYDLGMSISRLWREFDENNTWVRSVSKH